MEPRGTAKAVLLAFSVAPASSDAAAEDKMRQQ